MEDMEDAEDSDETADLAPQMNFQQPALKKLSRPPPLISRHQLPNSTRLDPLLPSQATSAGLI